MNKLSKSTKIIIILIIIVIIFLIVGVFILKNIYGNVEERENYDKQTRIKLNDSLWYEENPENLSYNIYDNEGNIIGIVYDEYGLEFYRDSPDYRPSIGEFFYDNDDFITEEEVE